MDLTVWRLPPNIYEFEVLLVLSPEKFGDIIPILNKKYNLGYIEGKDYKKDEENDSPCCLTNSENRIAVIMLSSYNNTEIEIACIAHELFHVITAIGNNVDLKINEHTTEAWAYFMSFYTHIILIELNKWLKEKEEKNKKFEQKYIIPFGL